VLYRRNVTRTIVFGGEHLDRLPPRVVLAGTHRSFPDVPLVRQGLRQTRARRLANRLVVAAGAEGAGWGTIGAKLGTLALGLYPIQQHRGRDASLRRLVEIADAGNAVLIFPQGAHTLPSEEVGDAPASPFQTGAARLAAGLDAIVVPFGLAGPERMMTPHVDTFKGRVLWSIPTEVIPGPLAIGFGPPMRQELGETPRAFTLRLQSVCFALSREAERLLDQAPEPAQKGPPA
jgi:1-acyl-sn-glycerol-3-phosphate acyltransferase